MLPAHRTSVLVLLLACGGGSGTGETDASGDASALDAAGTDAGSSVSLPCPDEPVTDGAACETEGHLCAWLGCPEGTTLRAECSGGSWSVEDLGCEPRPCGEVGNLECSADQLCVIRRGGAYLTDCSLGACTDGVIDQPCACEHCGNAPCTFRGLSVECDSCTSSSCP